MGKLYYPNENKDGCEQFTNSDFSDDYLFDESDDISPIVIIDRGHCTFVTKVRNVEKLGVKLAILLMIMLRILKVLLWLMMELVTA